MVKNVQVKVTMPDGTPAFKFGVAFDVQLIEIENIPGDTPPTRRIANTGVTVNAQGVAVYYEDLVEKITGVRYVNRYHYEYPFTVTVLTENYIAITVNDWPSPIKELRSTLLGTVGEDTRQLAALVLTKFINNLRMLVDADKMDNWGADVGDNPHINAGAILTSLTIAHCRAIATNNTELAATTLKGINGILNWLEHRQHPSSRGYFLRWKQAELDSRDNGDWKAEPSLDEYSGILLGLSWLRGLGSDCVDPNVLHRAITLLDGIGDYLKNSEGWLVRPQGDLTTRGPDIGASSWPLSRVLNKYSNDTPLRLSEQVKETFTRSNTCSYNLALKMLSLENDLKNAKEKADAETDVEAKAKAEAKVKAIEEVLTPLEDFYNAYKGTLQLTNTLVEMEDLDHEITLVKWAAGIAAVFGVLGAFVFPFAGSLLALMGYGINKMVNNALDIYDEKILDVNAKTMWDLFGAGLGKPSCVDADGFNAEIFDRNILAAFWGYECDAHGEPIFGASTRYTRPVGGDKDGWVILTIACRYWFSKADGMAEEFENTLIEQNASFKALYEKDILPVNLQTIEGFVLGYSLLCFIADINSGIEWGDYLYDPVADFSASPTPEQPLKVTFINKSIGTPSSWQWNFGDGTSSTDQNPVHIYTNSGTYSVTLTIKNSIGSSSQVIKSFFFDNPVSPPVAKFSASPTSGVKSLTVKFTNESSGSPLSSLWSFGDGTPDSTEQNPVHEYSNPGKYSVTLTVKNVAGSDILRLPDLIVVAAPPLVANFSANTKSGRAPLKVTFTDQSTGSPISWEWCFGDGTISKDKNPVHVYNVPGTKTVKLTVSNAFGSSSKEEDINVIGGKPPE